MSVKKGKSIRLKKSKSQVKSQR